MDKDTIIYRKPDSITKIRVTDFEKSYYYFVKQIAGQPYRLYWFCQNYFNLWFNAKKTVIGGFTHDEFDLEDFERKHTEYKYINNNENTGIFVKPKIEVFVDKEIVFKKYFENYSEAVLYARKFIKENNLNLVSLKTNF